MMFEVEDFLQELLILFLGQLYIYYLVYYSLLII